MAQSVTGLDGPAFARALDEASANGMLEEAGGPRLAFAFSHELVRRAVYDRLSRLRRAELHLRVAELLETESPPPIADLAHHYAAAVPLTPRVQAVRYGRLAADAAVAALAYDVAAAHLRRSWRSV